MNAATHGASPYETSGGKPVAGERASAAVVAAGDGRMTVRIGYRPVDIAVPDEAIPAITRLVEVVDEELRDTRSSLLEALTRVRRLEAALLEARHSFRFDLQRVLAAIERTDTETGS